MTRLTGRFDGRAVVLDNPQAVALPPETPVEILVAPFPSETSVQTPSADARQQALEEFRQANESFRSRQSPATEPPAKRWSREELYDEIV